jgi:RHS repeat-associated protein
MIQRFRDLAGGQMAAYSQFGYDAYGNLSAIEHRYPAGAMISQYSYTHDDLDRITSVVDPAGTVNYNYDETSQLLSADYSPLPTNPSPLSDESYSYDLNGNRTNTGYVTAADNRLEQAEIDGKLHSFQYDSEGNLIRRTNLNTGEVVEYTWDRRNRLVSVERRPSPQSPASSATVLVTFTYDAFDRRIAKTVSYPSSLNPEPSSELFVYDGIHIALVFTDPDASGPQPATFDSRFLFGPAVDMVLAEEHPSTLNAQPSSRTYWLLSDHLGSIRDIISPDCTGGGHIDYTAFGRVAAVFDYLGGAATLADLAATRFLFTGREYDAEIDLQYNRARYYDAAIGRFLSEDSIRDDLQNAYRYVGNKSLSRIDPSGLADTRLPMTSGETQEDDVNEPTHIATEDYGGEFLPPVPLTDREEEELQAEIGKREPTGGPFLDEYRRRAWQREWEKRQEMLNILDEDGNVVGTVRVPHYDLMERARKEFEEMLFTMPITMVPVFPTVIFLADGKYGHAALSAVGDVLFLMRYARLMIAAEARLASEMARCAPKTFRPNSTPVPQCHTRAYRAVGEAEFEDILATGRLRQGPNSLEGKWFADSLEGAQAHGRALYPDGRFRLVEADIPDNAPSLFRNANLDGRGPARYIHNDDLPTVVPRPLE